jgi:predicted AAA+ superfamily ATPase
MQKKKRTFETRGPVAPAHNYVVSRTAEIADLVERIKQGRYVVIFAPRQTGKTTFFRWAIDRDVERWVRESALRGFVDSVLQNERAAEPSERRD